MEFQDSPQAFFFKLQLRKFTSISILTIVVPHISSFRPWIVSAHFCTMTFGLMDFQIQKRIVSLKTICNVWRIEPSSIVKHYSVLLLWLVRFLMHQRLWGNMVNIFAQLCFQKQNCIYTRPLKSSKSLIHFSNKGQKLPKSDFQSRPYHI